MTMTVTVTNNGPEAYIAKVEILADRLHGGQSTESIDYLSMGDSETYTIWQGKTVSITELI